jgi:hypothetical protein
MAGGSTDQARLLRPRSGLPGRQRADLIASAAGSDAAAFELPVLLRG